MKTSIRTFFILFAFILAVTCSECFAADQQGFVKHKPFSKAELEEIKRVTDWDDIPVITNRKEYVEYLNDCFKERMSVIPIAFGKEFRVDPKNAGRAPGDRSLPLYVHWWRYQVIDDDGDDGTVKAVYQLLYYPGLRIADAYLKNDTSKLTDDELKVYKKVLPIVNQVKRMGNDLDKEWHVHKAIIRSAEYEHIDLQKEKTLHNISALGIFLDGSGNCQAFSDAFYMLGTMVGLNVGVITGMTKEEHVWNTITIDDSMYFVDVTQNRASINYRNTQYVKFYDYFNAPREIISATHSWNKDYELEPLEDEVDENYFYCTDLHYKRNRGEYGFNEDTAKEAIESVADGAVKNGWAIWYAMVPFDEYYSKPANVLKELFQQMAQRKWRGHADVHVRANKKWKYMFYTFALTRKR